MAAFFAADERVAEFSTAAIEHSRRIDSPISVAMALNQAAMLALFADDTDAAVRYVDEVWDVSDRFGLPFFRMVSTLTRAAAPRSTSVAIFWIGASMSTGWTSRTSAWPWPGN